MMSEAPAEYKRFPANWDLLPFTKAFKDRTGGQTKIQKGDYLAKGKLPIIDQGQSLVGGYTDDITASCNVELPCIIFGDHTKIFKFIDAPFAIGADGVKVLSQREDIDSKFAYYYFETLSLPDVGYSRHFRFLKRTFFPLPPLEEQKRIAAILDQADVIRRKRKEAIALTEELLRSTFLDIFGDPVTNPKDWKVTKLEDTFSRKPQIGTTKPAHSKGQSLVVRVGEIGGQNVELDKCGVVTLAEKDLEKFKCEPGDFLLARAIGSESHLGKASILQQNNQCVVFDSHVMRLRFDHKVLLPVFFLQWLKTKGGRKLFMKKAGRTAVQFNVNGKQISSVDIPLPPIENQRKFVRFHDKAVSMINQYDQAHYIKNDLFNSLLQKAFRGEL